MAVVEVVPQSEIIEYLTVGTVELYHIIDRKVEIQGIIQSQTAYVDGFDVLSETEMVETVLTLDFPVFSEIPYGTVCHIYPLAAKKSTGCRTEKVSEIFGSRLKVFKRYLPETVGTGRYSSHAAKSQW